MTAGLAFDGSGYRQRVLAVLQSRSPLVLDDPFLIADLDPATTTSDDVVRARVTAVLAFLQRERSAAKYKTLAAELVKRRAEWEGVLVDPRRRAAARQQVLAARRAADDARFGKVEGYLAAVRDRFGGIPRSRVEGLRRLAAAAGLSPAEFDQRLARERVLDDGGGAGVQPLPGQVRRQIRGQLEELARLRGGDAAGTASLWALLGVPPESDPGRLRAAYETAYERNQRRGYDREKTVTSDLLAQVRTRLLDGDPPTYTASLVEDAKDALRRRVEERVVLDGELTPVATEGLVREALALGYGLSSSVARSVVLALARELGAAVTTGQTVDYVVCPNCRQPEPVDGSRSCRYCGTALYDSCLSCGRETEAAAVACRWCGHSLRAAREAAQALAAAFSALESGRPGVALGLVAEAARRAEAAGGTVVEQVRAADRRARAAMADAKEQWRALSADLATRRLYAAAGRAELLAASASDVPGPGGESAADRLADLTARLDALRAQVATARALPPARQEDALAAVLAVATDAPDALEALARLPLAPPTGLRATQDEGSVLLRWQPSRAARGVAYRIVRRAAGQPGHPLGTTQAVSFADAGVPGGSVVTYEVAAVNGARRSEPVASTPRLVVRDLTGLRAELVPDGVRLSWTLLAARDAVAIERTIEASSPISGPLRRMTGSGGEHVDRDVQAGVTYRYRARAQYADPTGALVRTPGQEVVVRVTARPRPVRDLEAATSGGRTTLRWTVVPGAEVRLYAGTVPLAADDAEVDVQALGRLPARCVGSSRRGRLDDPAAAGELVYTPVTVEGDRAVVGRALTYLVAEPVGDLRADDRGDEIILHFVMPRGTTEARILWRRDRPPNGPDDPAAATAKVTNTSLEIRGGWHLPAPPDGSPYHLAVFPLLRRGSELRPVPAPARLHLRQASRPDPPRAPAAAARPRPTSTAPVPAVAGESVTASYTVTRVGWRRRTLRVEVRADGPLPALVLCARAGTIPPRMPSEGHEVARLPAAPAGVPHTLDLPLEGAQLPWGVRLLPAPGEPAARLALRHPPDDQLVVG